MFSKKLIQELINIGLSEHSSNHPFEWDKTFFIRKLLQSKMLVDRWDHETTDIFVHTKHQELVKNSLIDNEYFEDASLIDEVDTIWGANIYYTDNIPEDKGLSLDWEFLNNNPTDIDYDGNVLSLLGALFGDNNEKDIEFISRAIAVFPM